MIFFNEKEEVTQKRVYKALEERGILPVRGLNLSCLKPKYFNCQVAAKYKICIKEHKCDTYKLPCQCNFTTCSKIKRCNTCVHRKEICHCVSKNTVQSTQLKKENVKIYFLNI